MERRAGENSTAGLAASRPLFQRAADLAPWSPHVWCAWALAEWEGTHDPDRARELYAEGLDAEPTNTACLRGSRQGGTPVRAPDPGTGLPRTRVGSRAQEPRVRQGTGDARGTVRKRARAARYFNAAKQLGKEANATAKIKKTTRGGTRGTWEPKEAAAAARGNAAVVASRGASYGSARARLGGEAGGGAQNFRAVLAATRGESAAARRDRGGGVARAGGAATRRRLVARTRAGTPKRTTEEARRRTRRGRRIRTTTSSSACSGRDRDRSRNRVARVRRTARVTSEAAWTRRRGAASIPRREEPRRARIVLGTANATRCTPPSTNSDRGRSTAPTRSCVGTSGSDATSRDARAATTRVASRRQ